MNALPYSSAGALLLALLLLAMPARAGEVTPQARTLFREGVGLLKADKVDYALAYDKFNEAYALSSSPKILGNLGLCAMKLERDGEAIEAYERYLRQVRDIRFKERSAIKRDLRTLQRRVAHVRLTFAPPEVVLVDERIAPDGRRTINRYELSGGQTTLGVRAGNHRLRLEADGHDHDEWQLTLTPGQQVSKALRLTAKPTVPSPVPFDGAAAVVADEPVDASGGGIPSGVWLGVGITAALGVSAAITGGLTLSNKSSFDEALAAQDYGSAQTLKDEGETLALTTDVLLGATLASAIVTTVLLLVLPGDEAEAAAEVMAVRRGPFHLRPNVWLQPSGGGAGLIGSF